jgi:hypothetical protein
MPIVLRLFGYRIGFFSNENLEPPHVHVEREKMQAKFWLEPAAILANNGGFAKHELTKIRRIVQDHREFLLEKWHEHHPR